MTPEERAVIEAAQAWQADVMMRDVGWPYPYEALLLRLNNSIAALNGAMNPAPIWWRSERGLMHRPSGTWISEDDARALVQFLNG